MRQIEIKNNFPFSQQKFVGIYLEGGEDSTFDHILTNLFELDLKSRGYKTVNLFKTIHSSFSNYREGQEISLDSIASVARRMGVEWFVKADSKWETSKKTLAEGAFLGGFYTFGFNIGSLKSRITGHSTQNQDTLFAIDQTSKGNVYSNSSVKENYGFRQDPPWVLGASHISNAFNKLPYNDLKEDAIPTHEIPIRIVVDRSFQIRFSDWKNRIYLRILLANDHLLNELSVKLIPKTIEPWNYSCDDSFELAYNRLIKDFPQKKGLYTIAFTYIVNQDTDWDMENALGMGSIGGYHCIIRAKPSMPTVKDWNSIEEGLVVAHEFGHNLGCVHNNNSESIMFPTTKYMNLKFDEINKNIAQATLSQDPESSPKNRIKFLAEIYSDAYSNSKKNFYYFGATLASALSTLIENGEIDSVAFKNVDTVKTFFKSTVKDEVLQLIATSYFLYDQKEYKAALKVIKLAEEMEDQRAEIHLIKGYIYRKLEEPLLAEDEFNTWERLANPK